MKYVVAIYNDDYTDEFMDNVGPWLNENVGIRDKDWDVEYLNIRVEQYQTNVIKANISFKEEAHAVGFKLRWAEF